MEIKTSDIGSAVSATRGETLQDVSEEEIFELLLRSGYVLLRGFSPTVGEYEAFSGRFGTCAGTRDVHYPDSGAGLGFHAEDAYNPYRPDTIWFFCAYEGSDGGIPTGVVDGVELLEALPPDWRTFCRGTGIRFDRQWEADVWRSTAPVSSATEVLSALEAIPGVECRVLPDGSLYAGYEVPLVVRTADGRESFSNTLLQAATDQAFYGMSLSDGSPIPEGLLAAAEDLALHGERHVGWHTGDVAVIDNLRMMHRRSQYVQVDRDLRARHCEDFFGTKLPDASTPLRAWAKSLLQGDVGLPTRVGSPAATTQPRQATGLPSHV